MKNLSWGILIVLVLILIMLVGIFSILQKGEQKVAEGETNPVVVPTVMPTAIPTLVPTKALVPTETKPDTTKTQTSSECDSIPVPWDGAGLDKMSPEYAFNSFVFFSKKDIVAEDILKKEFDGGKETAAANFSGTFEEVVFLQGGERKTVCKVSFSSDEQSPLEAKIMVLANPKETYGKIYIVYLYNENNDLLMASWAKALAVSYNYPSGGNGSTGDGVSSGGGDSGGAGGGPVGGVSS